MRIKDLVPGDRVVQYPGAAVFVGAIPQHPLFPGLSLVIWWMEDNGRWHHDALSAEMELYGWIVDAGNREGNLRRALTPGAIHAE